MLQPLLPGFHSLPLPVAQLTLSAVLKCGQSFRWHMLPLPSPLADPLMTHEYRFCLRDRVVCLRQSQDTLFYRSVFPAPCPAPDQLVAKEVDTLNWLTNYFQLEVDLVQLYDHWSKRDIVFGRIRDRFAGIRILRQDPWENLVSFICSSNNNIARISKMIHSLCSHYSAPLLELCNPSSEIEASSYHPFPPPIALAGSEVTAKLRSLGFGYRADFIQRTAKMIVERCDSPTLPLDPESWLLTLRQKNTDDAREELLKFVGVGRKVADCVLLMSLDKKEVIPVDTHVHQIASKYYNISSTSSKKPRTNMTPKLYDEVSAKLADIWGEYAGWAHSVLFTADLKSFVDYGTTVAEEVARDATILKSEKLPMDDTVDSKSPTSSPLKRVRRPKSSAIESPQAVLPQPSDDSLYERIKRRRRG
ncbi:N-glycosylase/DNA lyase [Pleurotus eryngii]|uniref:DNA-(apurinic or apyrimidinic site) lyase n=1 Tax=Pleurotus eryngii TaxID=5323 RepID=A0A9P6A7B6_PLEER|nr:N-glycosylase/DNA lyase [Pleurotus eryngii]